MTFAASPVTDISFAKITFRNSGRRPIESKDFDTDITVEFDCDELLWFGYDSNDETTLKPEISKVDPSTLIVRRLLLNRGDEIRFSTLIRGSRTIKPTARISEVNELKEKQKSAAVTVDPQLIFRLLIPTALTLVGAYATFAIANLSNRQTQDSNALRMELETQRLQNRQNEDQLDFLRKQIEIWNRLLALRTNTHP